MVNCRNVYPLAMHNKLIILSLRFDCNRWWFDYQVWKGYNNKIRLGTITVHNLGAIITFSKPRGQCNQEVIKVKRQSDQQQSCISQPSDINITIKRRFQQQSCGAVKQRVQKSFTLLRVMHENPPYDNKVVLVIKPMSLQYMVWPSAENETSLKNYALKQKQILKLIY